MTCDYGLCNEVLDRSQEGTRMMKGNSVPGLRGNTHTYRVSGWGQVDRS